MFVGFYGIYVRDPSSAKNHWQMNVMGHLGLANTVRDWLKLTLVYWSSQHNAAEYTFYAKEKKQEYGGPQVAKAMVCVLIEAIAREGHFLKVTMCRHFLSDRFVLLFIDNGRPMWWIVDGEQKGNNSSHKILGE